MNFLHYADAGLPLYSNGIIVSRKALAGNGAHIAGLVRACARGWRAALANPADMLASLVKAQAQADRALEADRFEWIRNQQIITANVMKNGMGMIDRARFEKLATLLAPQAPLEGLVRIIEPRFLPALAERAV